MRTIIAHSAIIASTSAISIESIAAPDAFGPNGLNYSNNAASIDMSKISIDITEQGNGNGDKNEVCRDGQWAKIAYKAFLSNGNQVMGNDDFSGKDLIFTVGASQTFKCLDLAITQLKPGAKATIKCPSEFVYGGVATPAPLGGEPIPVDSDMSFEVDVNFCNHNPGGQDGGLYWGNDLTFGPLKPNTCVKIQGARQRSKYWTNPKTIDDTNWYCWKGWSEYCSSWTGPLTGRYANQNAEIFKIVEGLDGVSGHISIMPQVAKESDAYMLVNKWGSMRFGVGSNDHFKQRASFTVTANPNGDGSWEMEQNSDFAYVKGKKLVSWSGIWFSNSNYYRKSRDGDVYWAKSQVVDCPV